MSGTNARQRLRYNSATIARTNMANRLKFFAFFVFLTFVTSASAYVDPGSTLLMIQGALALIGGIVVFVKNPIKAIKDLVAKFKDRKRA
jgi:hypothetical protein